MSRKINIICFSGTGNTRWIVDNIVKVLYKNGIEVCQKSEKDPYIHEKGSEILLAFPANSQAISPYIWKYIKSLPNGNGDKVNVVITLNESATILKPLKKVLQKRGYKPQGAIEISMPNNIVNELDTTQDRLKDAFIIAEQFAQELVGNRVSWEEHKKGSSFVSFLSRNTVLPWVSMRLLFKLETDKTKCTKCGLCIKECPVQNIRMAEIPIHMGKCEFCMHCGAVCENGAVHIKGKPNLRIRSVALSGLVCEEGSEQ